MWQNMRFLRLLLLLCITCSGCRTKTGTITCWGYFEYDKSSTVYKEWNGPHYKFERQSCCGVWEGKWESMFTSGKTSEPVSKVRLELLPNGEGCFAEVERGVDGAETVRGYDIRWHMTEDGVIKSTYVYNEMHTYDLLLIRCQHYDILVHTSSGLHGGPPSYALLKRVANRGKGI